MVNKQECFIFEEIEDFDSLRIDTWGDMLYSENMKMKGGIDDGSRDCL